MKTDLKSIGKFVVKGLSTYSVGVVIDNIVKSTTPTGASPLARIFAQVGGYILSGMVGDKAAEYVDKELAIIFGQDGEEDAKQA